VADLEAGKYPRDAALNLGNAEVGLAEQSREIELGIVEDQTDVEALRVSDNTAKASDVLVSQLLDEFDLATIVTGKPAI
jgi:hypothetical protein